MRRFAALMVISMLTLAFDGHAGARPSLDTKLPPPAPIYEVDPGERPGYVLSPGYWLWDGKNHVWQHSRWVEKREGYVWVPDQWEQRGDKWHLNAGRWEEDEDYEDARADTPSEVKSPDAVKAEPAPKLKKHTKPKRVRKTNYRDPILWPSPHRR